MIVDIINSTTNEPMRIEIDGEDYDNFTTGELYECILDLLEVHTTEFLMYHNNTRFMDSDHIFCKYIFNNDEYVKMYIYPKMVSNTWFHTDQSGYNYVQYMKETYRLQQKQELQEGFNVKKFNRIYRKCQMRAKKHSKKCYEIEVDMVNPDMSDQDNQNTKNKMQDILSKMKKKQGIEQ